MKQNYKVFKVPMAEFLADVCGYPVVNQYYSAVRECKVWEFERTPELLESVDQYVSGWKKMQEEI